MNGKLNELTATELLRLYHSREVKISEVVESCLQQIDTLEPYIHAWVCLDREGIAEKAAELDQKLSATEKVGRLAGIPVGVKDIYNTLDMPTAMGSPIWDGFTPGNDARVVSKLRLQDALMLGKTVTAEFAVHYNDTTANPHNIEHSPGTSSSGSAAAVAASMVPVALGTQTAGSTMRPASYCGVYGFKPSFGLLPRTGVLKTTDTLDTLGFFSRGIEDLGLLLDIMRVHGMDYPIAHRLLNEEQRQTPRTDTWKIALIKGPKWGCAEEYARKALLDYAAKLSKEKSIEIDEVELSPDFNRAHEIHQVIYDRTLAYYFKEEFKQRSLVSDVIYEIITRGNDLNLDDYLKALQEQRNLIVQADRLLQDYEAILTLSTSGEAPLGLTAPDKPDTCLIWTMCHLPAVNLPIFKGPNGLPFGAQLVARRYNDILLLKLLSHLKELGHLKNVKYDLDPAKKGSDEKGNVA